MRLTLRTLLAWLDDTLPPVEVRQIGHQVSESPFAQELVERIHRVARQRRLTVPNSTGAEATDPNLVASYLDNELAPEAVADFEKRCLTSDVHLAEVASVHQILSLIGQKAKVPEEARNRMYRLVKGREAVSSKVPRAFSPPKPDPLTEPLVPWAPPPAPPRSALERYGPAGLVLALILVLGWSTWLSLNPPPAPVAGTHEGTLARQGPGPNEKPKADQGAEAKKATAAPAAASEAAPAAGTAAKGEAKGAPKTGASGAAPAEARTEETTPKQDEEASELPPHAVGIAGSTDGILLRFNTSTRAWERLPAKTPLKPGDQVVGLDHFREPIRLAGADLTLVGPAEVRTEPADKASAAEFRLVRGRVVVKESKGPQPFVVRVGDQALTITPPLNSPVGLELAGQGGPPTGLKIYSPDGEVTIKAGAATETLSGPTAVPFEFPSKFGEKERKDPPAWVTDTSPPPLDKQIGEQFARYFKSDREVIKSLLEAMDDEQKDVRQMAITSLGSLGEVGVNLVVPALSKPGDAVSRRAAIRTLRLLLAQGPDRARAVKDELRQFLGDDEAAVVEKLLEGYSSKEAHEEATYTKLVGYLTAPDPGIRELALDNLESLTGRDDLGYSADTPEGAGLKNWQDLLKRKELRPQATQPAPTPR